MNTLPTFIEFMQIFSEKLYKVEFFHGPRNGFYLFGTNTTILKAELVPLPRKRDGFIDFPTYTDAVYYNGDGLNLEAIDAKFDKSFNSLSDREHDFLITMIENKVGATIDEISFGLIARRMKR